MKLGRGFTAVAQRVPRLADLIGQCPCTPDCVPWARRGVGDMKLGRVLPPWHNGCHGSPVW